MKKMSKQNRLKLKLKKNILQYKRDMLKEGIPIENIALIFNNVSNDYVNKWLPDPGESYC